jgi:hypothetical protein
MKAEGRMRNAEAITIRHLQLCRPWLGSFRRSRVHQMEAAPRTDCKGVLNRLDMSKKLNPLPSESHTDNPTRQFSENVRYKVH